MEVHGFVHILVTAILVCKSTCAQNKLICEGQNLTSVPRPPAGIGIILYLSLMHNNIQVLNDTSFAGYDDLMTLYMSNNKLRYIMDGTFIKMYQLQILHMDLNAIVQLPNVFGPSEKTLELWILWRAIRDSRIIVYPYFAAFVNLKYLNLGGNHNMQPIDGPILPPNVTYLTLNQARMYEFPNISAFCPRIRAMAINNNQIREIPQSAIAWLPELVVFDVSDNYITQFPSFVNSALLENLEMQINKITVVPHENIEGLTRLRIFLLQRNLLSHMTNISHLTSLEYFNIGYNMITNLPEEMFQGLPNLIKLSCEYNQVAVLPHIIALLPSLRQFYMQGNRLLTLPDYYAHSSPLTFHVQDNPFICNRSLCWLRMLTWTNPTSPLSLDSPVCAEPLLVADTRVSRAHPTRMECYDGNF